MAIAAAIGMAIERFAYRPVRKYSKMTTLITAIGMSLLIEYLFRIYLLRHAPLVSPAFAERQHHAFWQRDDLDIADIDLRRFDRC